MNHSVNRLLLALALLILGALIGAAIYEMLVITPVWTGNPPESVRRWNSVAAMAIQPFSYKYPALIALSSTSFILFFVGVDKITARTWVLLGGSLCAALALATLLYSFPTLLRMLGERGASLTDEQIIAQVEQWRRWSRIRLAMLVVAWVATAIALTSMSNSTRLFGSQLRLK